MGNCMDKASVPDIPMEGEEDYPNPSTREKERQSQEDPRHLQQAAKTGRSSKSNMTATTSSNESNFHKYLSGAQEDVINEGFQETEKKVVEEVLGNDPSLKYMMLEFADIKLEQQIGSGAFGEVIKGKYRGAPVVIKRVLRHNITQKHIRMFAEEIKLMKNLRHPNIVQFLGASWNSYSNICMVTEYVERGDLFCVFRDPKITLSWHQHILNMIIDTARGMYYLHGHQPPILHRDLKSMNILVTSSFTCKIADFGMSREKALDDETMTLTGTPLWASPEVLRGQKYNEKVDVYSFGIVLSEFITRHLPYHHMTRRSANGTIKRIPKNSLMQKIMMEECRPRLPDDCFPALKDLFNRCVVDNAPDRPSIEEIVELLEGPIHAEIMSKPDMNVLAPGQNKALADSLGVKPATKYLNSTKKSGSSVAA